MTNTIDMGLARPTARRLRVGLREPSRRLHLTIGTTLAAFGLDVIRPDDLADVVICVLDAVAAATADLSLTAGPPVVALVDGATDDVVRRLYALGVGAVLDRASDPAVVAATAIAVGRGLVVARPTLVDLVPSSSAPLELDHHELRWMRALAAGKQMSAIAQQEGHSERDMYRKFRAVYAKLGVSGRAEALVLLARADLIGERTA
jgi:DNA-binding NarL/FixJ family response regulator